MAQLDPSRRLVVLKVVYWGPERSGKTTNVQHLHARYPEARRGRLVRLDTELEETHFFDYFPAWIGHVDDHEVRLDVLSCPGRPDLTAARHALLATADGVVFVADSSPSRRQDNLDALAELQTVLTTLEREVALVFQWNRRDRQRRMTVDELEALLNRKGAPSHAATAHQGEGVWETHRLVLGPLLERLRAVLPTVLAEDAPPDASQDFRLFVPAVPGPPPTVATARPHPAGPDGAPDDADAEPPPPAGPSPHTVRVHTLARTPGVTAAAIGLPERPPLAAIGPIDAAPMITTAAHAARALTTAADALGLGRLRRWSADLDALSWYVEHAPDALVVACGPTTPTPGEALTRIFGPEEAP